MNLNVLKQPIEDVPKLTANCSTFSFFSVDLTLFLYQNIDVKSQTIMEHILLSIYPLT